jgi:hypothetical protein
MIHRWERACAAVEAGVTSPAEIRRTLGVGKPPARMPNTPRSPEMREST